MMSSEWKEYQLEDLVSIHDSERIPVKKNDRITLRVPLPIEQKQIAHILGTLDDKIELNRKMNETLEQMAQALFKSWFVDFDPVIDNVLAAGNEIPEELQAKAEKRKSLGYKRKPLPEDIQKLFNYFVHIADGGAYPAIRPEVISNFKSLLPQAILLENFYKLAYPFIKTIGKKYENNKLFIYT